MPELPSSLQDEVNELQVKFPDSKVVIEHLISFFKNELSKVDDTLKRKKQRDDNDPSNGQSQPKLPASLEGVQIMLQIPDLSVQSPFRKKVNLVIAAYPGQKPFIALTKAMDKSPEFMLEDLNGTNVRFATILRVPEKSALRVLLISYHHNLGELYKNDPLLVQFNNDTLSEQFGSILTDTNLVSFLLQQLSALGLPTVNGSTDNVFFVPAYNVTKEGYLYFLSDYVIFGFKKPVLIFKTSDIESVTYTSITRLTFNVSLNLRQSALDSSEGHTMPTSVKYEFSMIDQKEFERINEYVKAQQFEDKSMAEELKAQKQLKSGSSKTGALNEAAKLVPGAQNLVDEDDEEYDANYELSEDEEAEDDEEEDEDEEEEEEEEDKNDKGDKTKKDDEDDSQEDSEMEDDYTSDHLDDTQANLKQELKDLEDDLDENSYLPMDNYPDMSEWNGDNM